MLILFALAVALLPQPSQADLFDRYPVTETVTLSNGATMGLPLHDYKSQGEVLAGTADLEKLKAILDPHGLEPTAILPHRGLVMFFFMDYQHTALGPYQELVVLIAAQKPGAAHHPVLGGLEGFANLLAVYLPLLSGALNSSTGDYGFYTWKLWVNSENARLAGLEVWGFPKSASQINISIQKTISQHRVAEADGQPVLSVLRDGFWLPALPIRLDLQMFTPRETLPTAVRGIADTRSQLTHFRPLADKVVFHSESEWGRRLGSIDFQPLLWQTMREVKAVFLKPHANPRQ